MTLFGLDFYCSTIDFLTAAYFVNRHHRHCKAPMGHKFSIGCWKNGKLVGVAICGRPVARKLDNGTTIEVTRLCTTGEKNACSKLYSYCAKMAKKQGYKKIITYTLMSESGSSLKASNFILEAENAGKLAWTGQRKYKSKELKKRWSKDLNI